MNVLAQVSRQSRHENDGLHRFVQMTFTRLTDKATKPSGRVQTLMLGERQPHRGPAISNCGAGTCGSNRHNKAAMEAQRRIPQLRGFGVLAEQRPLNRLYNVILGYDIVSSLKRSNSLTSCEQVAGKLPAIAFPKNDNATYEHWVRPKANPITVGDKAANAGQFGRRQRSQGVVDAAALLQAMVLVS